LQQEVKVVNTKIITKPKANLVFQVCQDLLQI